MASFQLTSFGDADALALAVARTWLEGIAQTDRADKPHFVALSGGRIAKNFFSAVVERCGKTANSLNSVHFFWADERCVPSDDAESNFADAQKLLFQPLGIH